MNRRKSTGCAIVFALLPSLAAAQALPNLNSARVAYTTRRNTVNPQGELKAQIESVDKAMTEAARLGQTGEVRRQIAKGLSLLDGIPWTPALDYRASLTLRTERTIADSSAPYDLRIAQIYAPAIELKHELTTKVALRPRRVADAANPPAPPAAQALASFAGVGRDLRESPFLMTLDLSHVADGAYTIEAELLDEDTSLGVTALPIFLLRGLDARLRALEATAAGTPPALRADVRFPIDYIRGVNHGDFGLGTFALATELAAAEAVATQARRGVDPFKGKHGDIERHYLLGDANEVLPYRLYVPTSYSATRSWPLVIALHGLGGNEDSFFDQYNKLPIQLAEQHGFLMAAPNGYRVDGFYGSPIASGNDPGSDRRRRLSEQDTLEVLRLMREQYKVDDSRIYLLGHSMGAIGGWFLAGKHPEIWAGLALFAGAGAPATAEAMKAIPQFIVHGDADKTVPVGGSRTMVAAMKKLNMDVTYLEVPNGSHRDVVVPNLPAAFDFFAKQQKKGR